MLHVLCHTAPCEHRFTVTLDVRSRLPVTTAVGQEPSLPRRAGPLVSQPWPAGCQGQQSCPGDGLGFTGTLTKHNGTGRVTRDTLGTDRRRAPSPTGSGRPRDAQPGELSIPASSSEPNPAGPSGSRCAIQRFMSGFGGAGPPVPVLSWGQRRGTEASQCSPCPSSPAGSSRRRWRCEPARQYRRTGQCCFSCLKAMTRPGAKTKLRFSKCKTDRCRLKNKRTYCINKYLKIFIFNKHKHICIQ